MEIRCYLAMTAQEMQTQTTLPPYPGWMACHFSCYGTGLSNLPGFLPPESMLIVNDRTPICGHDPTLIKDQLTQLCEAHSPSRILLDLQRPGQAQTDTLVNTLLEGLPCPIGVSEAYAEGRSCPVFVAPCPLCTPLEKHLAPWQGREVWLDIAMQAQAVTINRLGSHPGGAILEELPEPVFTDETLCCRYHMQVSDDRVIFHLERREPELKMLLEQAKNAGVSCAVGLYQQLGGAAVLS